MVRNLSTIQETLACLENSVDRGAWQGTVHGVAKSQIHFHFFHFQSLSNYSALLLQQENSHRQ